MSAVTFQILDASDASLNKTSVIVAGDSEAVVVDPGFTRADGHRVVAALLDANKTPKAVLITAGDPDFYFGAEVLADAFPGVAFLAPADVIAHIRESYEGKLQACRFFFATELPQIELAARLVSEAEPSAYAMRDEWY